MHRAVTCFPDVCETAREDAGNKDANVRNLKDANLKDALKDDLKDANAN